MNLNELKEALNKVSDNGMLKKFHFWHDLCTDEEGAGKMTLMFECDDEEEDACRELLYSPEMKPLIEFGKELNEVAMKAAAAKLTDDYAEILCDNVPD